MTHNDSAMGRRVATVPRLRKLARSIDRHTLWAFNTQAPLVYDARLSSPRGHARWHLHTPMTAEPEPTP